jgi:asparagine synthase (glutamine-hydrolysing)
VESIRRDSVLSPDSSDSDRLTADAQRAFVATYPGTPKDELRFAALAIDYTNSAPRLTPLNAEIAVNSLYQFAYDFENFGGSLMMPAWQIYRALRRDQVVVSLDGHGADELLGGYRHYALEELRRTSPWRSPLRTLDLVRAIQPLGSDGTSASSSSHLKLLFGQLPLVNSVYRGIRGVGHKPQSGHPLDWVDPPPDETLDQFIDPEDQLAIATLDPLNQQLYHEFHHTRLQHILRNFDRCSMAHGVEVRMPFMDWRLVCFGFGLPSYSKIGGGYTKRILRHAMRGRMPEALRTRKDKIGFAPPMLDWFNCGLGDWVLQQVRNPTFVDSTVWNGLAIKEFVEDRASSGLWTNRDCERVWPFIQAHLWSETFFGSVGETFRSSL